MAPTKTAVLTILILIQVSSAMPSTGRTSSTVATTTTTSTNRTPTMFAGRCLSDVRAQAPDDDGGIEPATPSPAPEPTELPSTTTVDGVLETTTTPEEEPAVKAEGTVPREQPEATQELLKHAPSSSWPSGRYAWAYPRTMHSRSLVRDVYKDVFHHNSMDVYKDHNSMDFHKDVSQDMYKDVTKDIYIHLANDPVTTRAPPLRRPRKHYKIILIKPPTPAPTVEAATVRDSEETLIYVLIPKAADIPKPPLTTTPHTPSKHEVFFVRYKASNTSSPPSSTPPSSTPSTDHKANMKESLTSTTARSLIATPSPEINEVDSGDWGRFQKDDTRAQLEDLAGLSSDDVVRSWRRSDGDIHFDVDLRRIVRSHHSQDDAEQVRCKEYTAAEDLNTALSSEGKMVEGGPDFEAVRRGRAHLGSERRLTICTMPSTLAPQDADETVKNVRVSNRKFSARFNGGS